MRGLAFASWPGKAAPSKPENDMTLRLALIAALLALAACGVPLVPMV